MQILADSHVLVWWATAPKKLTPRAQDLLADTRNAIWFSVASVWELSLKAGKGKLRLPATFFDDLERHGLLPLTIQKAHAIEAGRLPRRAHADPFDRLLVAQARIEG
ncbi:MAG: type II toxin-antitoxin system VapC family toxin, partial [Parvularcula sp.]|nr:type II toxin-antitoxin system VapC family toxin [Parvularcula sp.]